MTEGWHDKDYVQLFDEADVYRLTQAYRFPPSMIDYRVIGLIGWDDFILKKYDGSVAQIPTVPLDFEYLRPLPLSIENAKILPDSRFVGKIKWYIQPLVFGGDATSEKNMAWLSLDQHIQAVTFWNRKYLEIRSQQAKK